jgi:hypothetical protein
VGPFVSLGPGAEVAPGALVEPFTRIGGPGGDVHDATS